MAHEPKPEDPQALQRAREVGHELRDTNVNAVAWFGLGLAALIAVTLVAMYGLVLVLGGPDVERGSILMTEEAPTIFDEDLRGNQQRLRQVQERLQREVLTSYGWVDEPQQIARVPIDRAIEWLAERDDPALPLPQPAADQRQAATKDAANEETL